MHTALQDQPVEQKAFLRTFLVDDTPGALSSGRELIHMLYGGRIAGSKEETPLFRMPVTGRKVTLEEFRTLLKRKLQ